MNMQNIKEEIVGKYKIQTFEYNQNNGKIGIYAKIFNTNAKKEWKAQIAFYNFRNEEERSEYVSNFKKRVYEKELYKQERAQARKNAVNPYKVGDILYSSWGYDQTNIDFYQVVAVNGKSVELRELKREARQDGMDSGKTKAIKNAFASEKSFAKRVTNSNGYINLNSYSSLSRWNGEEMYYSWGH